jgi:Fe-S cluster biogenesis protein NfuA
MEVVDKVGSSKVWGYVAMAGGLFAVIGIALVIKEKMDAQKIAKVKEAVAKDVEEIIAENGGEGEIIVDEEEIIVDEEGNESFSGCGGCSSSVIGERSGGSRVNYPLTSKTGYTF